MPSSRAVSALSDSIAPRKSPSTYRPVASTMESPAVRRIASHSSALSSTGVLPCIVTAKVGTASTEKASLMSTTRSLAMTAACS